MVSSGSVLGLALSAAAAGQLPPPGYKVAFIGDQGDGANALAVLQLIHDEGADAVVHSGDFDYDDDPAGWDAMIGGVLGENFPYFASVGNHDEDVFYGPGGYQEVLEARCDRLGVQWDGDLGNRSAHAYGHVLYVLLGPDIFGDGDTDYAPYLREQLAASNHAWRIASWHVLMRDMQVGGKNDQSGWGVYEEARMGGAIVATGHEHSYARTFPLSHMPSQTVAESSFDFSIDRDDPESDADEGVTFAFHNGLGGHSIRDQERCMPTTPPYGCHGEWASIYTEDQGATHGALFLEFFGCEAHGYFKDVDGNVIDDFQVHSKLGDCAPCPGDLNGDGQVNVQDWLSMLAEFGACPGCPQDLNSDGFVDVSDYLLMLQNWSAACAPACPGDLTGDGQVDTADFLEMLGGYGPCQGCAGDLTGDGVINVLDYLLLIAIWGEGC